MFISLIFQSIFLTFSLLALIVITHVHPTSRAHTLPITCAHTLPITCAHTTRSHFLTQSTSMLTQHIQSFSTFLHFPCKHVFINRNAIPTKKSIRRLATLTECCP